MLPLTSIPEANNGIPFFGSSSRKIPGPALSVIVLPTACTSSVGWPRSAARMCRPAPACPRGNPRAPESVLRSTRRRTGPDTETTSRLPPVSVESLIVIRSIMPAEPGSPSPTTTSVLGPPPIER